MTTMRDWIGKFCEVGHEYDFVTRTKRHKGRLVLWPPYSWQQAYEQEDCFDYRRVTVPLPAWCAKWLDWT